METQPLTASLGCRESPGKTQPGPSSTRSLLASAGREHIECSNCCDTGLNQGSTNCTGPRSSWLHLAPCESRWVHRQELAGHWFILSAVPRGIYRSHQCPVAKSETQEPQGSISAGKPREALGWEPREALLFLRTCGQCAVRPISCFSYG